MKDWKAGVDYPNWMTEEALQTLTKGYLGEEETPYDMYQRLTSHSKSFYEKHLSPKDMSDYETMLFTSFVFGWFSPATPVASNFGARKKDGTQTKHFPISCFSVHLDNSIDSIFGKLHECSMLTKRGGGLGVFLGEVVGSTLVSDWMTLYDKMAEVVSQSGVRRGSVALYLDITHPDLQKVFIAKDFTGGGDPRLKIDSNIALTISNDYMEKVSTLEGVEYDTFFKALEMRLKTGSPYITYIDNANEQAPQIYKDKDMKISTSNLCLTGDTKVVTANGFYDIKDLVGGSHTIWDGENWVNNNQFRYLGDDYVYHIKLSNGVSIKATADHHWYVSTNQVNKRRRVLSTTKALKTIELKPGDQLYNHGLLDYTKTGFIDLNYPTREVALHLIQHRKFPEDLLQWSYFDRCAVSVYLFLNNVYDQTNSQVFFESSVIDDFTTQVFYLFKSIGLNPKIVQDGFSDEGVVKVPKIQIQQLFDYIDINNWDKHIAKQLKFKKFKQDQNADKLIILSIEKLPNKQPVYCTTVPSTRKFALACGAITGNCNEIFQYTDPDHTFTCVLSSLNLYHYDTWSTVRFGKFDVVTAAIYFLDSVCEDFIRKAKKQIDAGITAYYPSYRSAIKGRALGLGTMGLHAYYMRNYYPFASKEAREFNSSVHEEISIKAKKASRMLASFMGEPEWCEGYDVRNSVLMAIAPTTSNSVLCNAVTPGIEPIHGNVYTKIGAKGTFVRKNPELVKVLEKYGQHNSEVINSIIQKEGSVQHLHFLTKHEREVFKTFAEINQFEIIKQAADRQKYIDQGQSLNLYIPHDIDSETLVALHIYAWQQGLKGLYYVRSNSSTKTSKNKGIRTQSDIHIAADDKVLIHTRKDCPYCVWAKELLDRKHVTYEEIEQNKGTVPQIYINDKHLGGCTELYAFFDETTPWEEEEECLGCSG